ncbi:hypothetical protein EV424DRAFT_1551399 [Suillus variegatus]|nr:hypothetical protein EV424DRAFT_1551399 [Suillus variegatus]
MASSTKAAATKSGLTPTITLRCHGEWVQSISYLPDGQRISEESARQWNPKSGKELMEARGVGGERVCAVAVSRDGRWVVTAGGDGDHACTINTEDDYKICICNTLPDVLAQAITTRRKSTLDDLLNSRATRRLPGAHRRPPIAAIPGYTGFSANGDA